MTVYAIITFHTTHFSLKAKKVLEKSGMQFETIPVPRKFSADCGFCCKVLWEAKEEVEKILDEHNVQIDSIYRWKIDEDREKKKKFTFV